MALYFWFGAANTNQYTEYEVAGFRKVLMYTVAIAICAKLTAGIARVYMYVLYVYGRYNSYSLRTVCVTIHVLNILLYSCNEFGSCL